MPQQLGQNKFVENALKYGFSLWGTPKSGQTTKYRTGDDGDLEKGYPRTGTRFVDNGDGTITDNATGLMWVKDPSQLGGVWGTPGNPSRMTWNNAIDNCLALNYAGHNDWRLPNSKELDSLVIYYRWDPCVDPILFPYTALSYYWTSTTLPQSTGKAVWISFRDGYRASDFKASSWYVRPVRLGVN